MTVLFQSLPMSEIATVVHGTVAGKLNARLRDVQVDSRLCSSGSLFVALEGENTDGHLFVEDAFRRGSSLSFISRQYYGLHRDSIDKICVKYRSAVVAVDRPITALQLLARAHLGSLDPTIVGITGSNGKTTTKELLGAMIGGWAQVMMSPGNYNSDIGVPLASFSVTPDDRYAVFEMGTNRPGEIAELVSTVQPSVAAVTGVANAHLGAFGSLRGIAEEKRAVFAHVCNEGRGFVPEADPMRSVLTAGIEGCVEFFGSEATAGFAGSRNLGLNGVEIDLDGEQVRSPLSGDHQLGNILCAVSIARYLGVPGEQIRAGISMVQPGFARGQVLRGRKTIYLDCYNANRESVLRAIETVESISWTGRKILVLGSMKELGDASVDEHRVVGRAAAASEAEKVYFFGEEAAVAYRAAAESRPAAVCWHDSFDSLADSIAGGLEDGDLVLLKGSRSTALERLVPIIDPDLQVVG